MSNAVNVFALNLRYLNTFFWPNTAYTKGRPLALEIQASLDQIYRSNPYPSRFEYEGYSKDLDCDVVRIRVK